MATQSSEQSSRRADEVVRGQRSHFGLAILAAVVSGGLMATCYWPLNLHFLAWVALVPWLVMLPRLSAGWTWLYGIVLGFVYYRIGLAWLLEIGGPIGAACVLALAVLMGLSFRVAKLMIDRFGLGAMIWAVPLAFVGQEILRCEGLPRYRLAYVAWGYSQSHNHWIAQIASLGGVYFVSFLVVAFNAAIAFALVRRKRVSWIPAGVIAVITLALAAVSQPQAKTTGREIVVACVQGEDLRPAEYLDLTTQAVNHSPKPEFIVLPEHTIESLATNKHPLVVDLARLAREHGIYVCVGAHIAAPRGAECYYENTAMLIGPEGEIVGTQAKVVPVPFFQDGNPARSLETFDTTHGRLGMFVCYDGTFTDIPRRLTTQGAGLFLVPVMDAERWPAQQLWQHADMAPFRSIELRRAAVRAATSGLSQIIDMTGSTRQSRTRQEGPGVIWGSVSYQTEKTFFVRVGYLFATIVGLTFLGAVVILSVAGWVEAIRKRERRSPPAQAAITETHSGDESSMAE